jgi:hypothetical protein
MLGGLKGTKGGQHRLHSTSLKEADFFSVRSYIPNGSGEQSTHCLSQDSIGVWDKLRIFAKLLAAL